MGSFLADALSGIATVALTASVVRWLANAKGTDLPENHGETDIYRISWPWRGTGILAGSFAVVLALWSFYDLHHLERGILIFSAIMLLLGVWLSAGVVTTDGVEITKKVLWHSRTFVWGQITEIRQLQSRGERAIEVRSGPVKMVVDFRYNRSNIF